MARHADKHDVVRVDPVPSPQAPPRAVSQVQVIHDPHTGQPVPVVQDPNTGHYIPVHRQPTAVPPPPRDGRGGFLNDNAIGTHTKKRVRVIEYPNGTRAYEMDLDEAEVRSRTVSDDTHRAMHGGSQDIIPDTMSKKRLFIGGVLALLVLMVLADIVGVPHVRTAPGEYASLEGVKEVGNPDGPLVILKRLDRSVFLYTIDGIGWVFRRVGGGA